MVIVAEIMKLTRVGRNKPVLRYLGGKIGLTGVSGNRDGLSEPSSFQQAIAFAGNARLGGLIPAYVCSASSGAGGG